MIQINLIDPWRKWTKMSKPWLMGWGVECDCRRMKTFCTSILYLNEVPHLLQLLLWFIRRGWQGSSAFVLHLTQVCPAGLQKQNQYGSVQQFLPRRQWHRTEPWQQVQDLRIDITDLYLLRNQSPLSLWKCFCVQGRVHPVQMYTKIFGCLHQLNVPSTCTDELLRKFRLWNPPTRGLGGAQLEAIFVTRVPGGFGPDPCPFVIHVIIGVLSVYM